MPRPGLESSEAPVSTNPASLVEGLVDAATQARIERAAAGHDASLHVTVAGIAPGSFGVLDASVRMVAPARPYRSKSGRDGLLQRVTLGDRTGEVVLVLWDDETRYVRDGTLAPGRLVRIRGASAEAGWRGGGVELKLGAAAIEPLAVQQPAVELVGVLESVGPAQVVGEPPSVRFQADAVLLTAAAGRLRVALWDAAVRDARSMLAGGRVRITAARPNPAMEGWWVAEDGARVERI